MDHLNDTSPNNSSGTSKENEFLKKALEVTTTDVYKEVFRCAAMVAYCFWLFFRIDFGGPLETILLLPVIGYLVAYIIGNMVIAYDPEPYIKEGKQLKVYLELMERYRTGKDIENE